MTAPGTYRDALRPPWSTKARIRQNCTSCGDCISACPEGILFRGRAGTPVIRLDTAPCTFCGRCAQACPEQVFAPITDKPWNLAAQVSTSCLLHLGITCQSCTDACDEDALRLDYRSGSVGAMRISHDACTGCGACIGPCPAGAITLAPAREKEPA